VLAGAALLAPLGCGGGGGGASGCQPFDKLASAKPKADDPKVAAGTQLAAAVKAEGAAAKTVAAGLAPAVAPSYQAVKPGATATWGVAVVQVADRARSLKVDFPDGSPSTTSPVPKGAGACLFRVTRSLTSPGKGRPVHFTLLDPASPAGGPALDAFVDVA
jgi:hypothetical protein